MTLEYLGHCFHVNIFLIFNPVCLELSCLFSGFRSLVEPWRTSLKVRSLGKIVLGRGGGKKEVELFPLKNFCIQFVSFQAKQMGILFIPFSTVP